MRIVVFLLFLSLHIFAQDNLDVRKTSINNTNLEEVKWNKVYSEGLYFFKIREYNFAYDLFIKAFELRSDNLLMNYYLGRSAFMIGRYEEALAAYERVLIKDPKNIRTKLEIAYLYYKIKSLNTSKVEFQLLLKNEDLPDSVRLKILKYLTLIEQKSKKDYFNGTYILGFNYDSNINSMGRKGDFSIYVPELNTNVTVPNSGNKKDSLTISNTLLFNYLHKKNDTLLLKTSLAIFRHDYLEDANKEEDVYALSFTPMYKYNEINFSTTLGINVIGINSKSFMKTYNISQDINKILSKNLAYTLSLKYTQKVYSPINKNKDAKNYEIRNSFTKKSKAYGIYDYSIIYSKDQEDKNVRTDVSFQSIRFKLNHIYKLNKLLSLNTKLMLQKKYYKDKDLNFLNTREDDKIDLSTGLNYIYSKKIKFSILGTYSDNYSNHYPFSYDKYTLKSNMIVSF